MTNKRKLKAELSNSSLNCTLQHKHKQHEATETESPVPKIKKTSLSQSSLDSVCDQSITSTSSSLQRAAGYIQHIKLKNFKCHGLLELSLHPSINFILGRNGSGKSAVMDGIILCLGGTTAFTGRQTNVKTFIKSNSHQAELSVTIANQGTEAYKRHLYGDKIIVERKINSSGASQYRLFNQNNQLVSKSKAELDNLLEQFNIQVNNPVCFLNQETSKNFLNSSKSNDKYRLFMKASQLESMKHLHELAEKERIISEQLILDRRVDLEKLADELYKWEMRVKQIKAVKKLEARAEETKMRLAFENKWACVVHLEKYLKSLVSEKLKVAELKDKNQAKIKLHELKLNESKNKFEHVTKNIDMLNELIKGLDECSTQLEARKNLAHQNLRATEAKKSKYAQFISKKREEQSQLIDKVNEEKSKLNLNTSQGSINIDRIKKQLAENLLLDKQLADENQSLTNQIDTTQKSLNDKSIDLKGIDAKMRSIEAEIARSSNNKLFRFGDFMKCLTDDVKQHFDSGKLKEMPRGPIGMHIQPKDQEWSLAIEQCLGLGLLRAFICGSYQDESTMHQIISKHVKGHMKPRVIVQEFNTQLYNINRFRPVSRSYPTVYDMLSIDDPIVANALIDQCRIESILLLPDMAAGRQLIETRSDSKCNEAFLINGDYLSCKPTYKVYGCRLKQPAFLVHDTQTLIETKHRELDELKESSQKHKLDINQLGKDLIASKQTKAQNDKRLEAIRKEYFILSNQLKDIESIKLEEPADIVLFEEEIEKLKHLIEESAIKSKALEEGLIIAREEFQKADKESNDFEDEKKIRLNEVTELQSSYNTLEQQRVSDEKSIAFYKSFLKEYLDKEKELDKKIATAQLQLDKMTEDAESYCPRIATKKSIETIQSELKALELQLKQFEKDDENEISKVYLEKRAKFEKLEKDVNKQTKFLIKLKNALDKREDIAKHFTESKALRCCIHFTSLLNSRNYAGNLSFDHVNQQLDITVSTKVEKNDVKDLKSLSGGERSFSTVAFLLSLWSIVESPLLFLDEFDVFMDQINRSFAIDLILSECREKFDGQYVFLTPQEMGPVKPDEYLKIFKMPDPSRK